MLKISLYLKHWKITLPRNSLEVRQKNMYSDYQVYPKFAPTLNI